MFGYDVDHAVHRVGPPYGAAWPPNDLDTLDVFERNLDHIPIGAREGIDVNTPAIYQDQNLVRKCSIESANADGPLVGIDPRHIDARHHPEEIRNIGRARSADIFPVDDVYGGTGLGKLLVSLGDRSDMNIHQVFQAELGEVARSGGLGRAGACDSPAECEGNTQARQENCSAISGPAIAQRFRHKALIGSLRRIKK